MRKVVVLLSVLGLLLSLAACGNGPLVPTATPIPLAVTATPRPRSTQLPTPPPSTATPTALQPPEPTPTIETPTGEAIAPTVTASELLAHLDDQLARRTVTRFLDRLAAGTVADALYLYLTDEALAGEPGRLFSQVAGSGAQLASVTLYEFLWATDATYEARAELRWAASKDGGPATQSLELVLTYERGLWLIDDATLGKLQVIAPTPTPKAATGTGRRPQLDGRLVFQTSSGGNIYTINANGRGLRRLTDGLDPAWSPIDDRIAFTRWRSPWGVYLIQPDGTGEQRVVDGIKLKEVAWSPDGSQLAFTINYGSDEPITICFFGFCFTIPPFSFGHIWTINLETGAFLNLPLDDQAVHAPAWSPVEDRIVYAGDRGLSWIDLDDMDKDVFAGSSAWDTSPAFSPDGTKIAFMGRVHTRWEIFAMNADGSGRKQLTHSDPKLKAPPSNVAPAWSPNGKYIAFLSNRDGPWRIYVMKANGAQQRAMFGDALDGLGFRYEWATERVVSWSE